MNKLTISGWNPFYSGWLHAILLQPCPEEADESFKDGYSMAKESGLGNAITALQPEITLKHIIVTSENEH